MSPFKQAMSDDQSYFWTPEWQAAETEAEEDLHLGCYDTFETGEALLADFMSIIENATDSEDNILCILRHIDSHEHP